MKTYTVDAQTLSLQQAALERVRAMQRRSALASPPPPPPPAPEAPPAPQPAPPPQRGRGAQNGLGALFSPFLRRQGGDSFAALGDGVRGAIGSAAQPIGQLLDGFGIGGEELTILLVMYAVFRERGDATLLMALGYLLL